MKIFEKAAIDIQNQISKKIKTNVKFIKYKENNILMWINGDICHNVAIKTIFKVQNLIPLRQHIK